MVGLPLAYVSCFRLGWGVQGLWAGLAVGLVLVGITLLVVWDRRGKFGSESGSALEVG
jgi:Na+-driven multidrug efflux pump